jgi:hypothetical protein
MPVEKLPLWLAAINPPTVVAHRSPRRPQPKMQNAFVSGRGEHSSVRAAHAHVPSCSRDLQAIWTQQHQHPCSAKPREREPVPLPTPKQIDPVTSLRSKVPPKVLERFRLSLMWRLPHLALASSCTKTRRDDQTPRHGSLIMTRSHVPLDVNPARFENSIVSLCAPSRNATSDNLTPEQRAETDAWLRFQIIRSTCATYQNSENGAMQGAELCSDRKRLIEISLAL